MNLPACAILALALLVAGCATALPPEGKPRVAPSNSSEATIYVIDDLGGIPLGGEIVMANGKRIAGLNRRQFTWFCAPAGTLKLSMNDPSLPGHKMSAQIFKVEAGKTYFVRYAIAHRTSDGALLLGMVSGASRDKDVFSPDDLTMISEKNARYLMSEMKLVGSRNP